MLIAVLAVALLARMVLNVRLHQYGYWQAALAALIAPAVLLGELPAWLRLSRARWVVAVGTLALISPVVGRVVRESHHNLRAKTFAVGEGADRFLAFTPESEPTAYFVHNIARALRVRPDGERLVVLPEGQMINYLARKASPVAPFAFYSAAIADGREARLVPRSA